MGTCLMDHHDSNEWVELWMPNCSAHASLSLGLATQAATAPVSLPSGMQGNHYPVPWPEDPPERCTSYATNSPTDSTGSRRDERSRNSAVPGSKSHGNFSTYPSRDVGSGNASSNCCSDVDSLEGGPQFSSRNIQSATSFSPEQSADLHLDEGAYSDDTITTPTTTTLLKRNTRISRSFIYFAWAFALMIGLYMLASLHDFSQQPASTTMDYSRDSHSLSDVQESMLLRLARDKRSFINEQQDHVQMIEDEFEKLSQIVQNKENEESTTVPSAAFNNEYIEAQERMQSDQALLFRSMATQKFGSGPHFAEFTIILDGESQSFTIEFASLDVAPTSVFFFLQQIEHGLWDNTAFHANNNNILEARPISAQGGASNFPSMERLGLARLPFSEYSERYTHKQYTLGFEGNVLPGPNFFINKADNSNEHSGTPCFAKVIRGVDTIRLVDGALSEKTASAPVPVQIQSVRIVENPTTTKPDDSAPINSHRIEH